MELARIPAQYAMTILDLLVLKRPKAFSEAVETTPSRYLHPYAFLAANVSIAGVLAAWAFVSRSLEPQDQMLRVGITIMYAVIAIFHCVLAIVATKSAAFLLNESAEVASVFSAFCYTSIFYVPLAPLSAFMIEPSGADSRLAFVAAVTALQVVAAGFLFSLAAHLSALHGRRLLAFVSVCASTLMLLIVPASIGIAALIDDHEHYSYSPCELPETWPAAALTLPVDGITPRTAVLIGASVGPRAEEHFEFGSTRGMTNTASAKNGVAILSELSPNTTYYYRYVTTIRSASCMGHTRSFTTTRL